jgi:membrane protease YdiL (CAAX protease family)
VILNSRQHRPLRHALGLAFAYLVATMVAHTLLYTIVAYLVSAADKQGSEFGNTVNEIAGQYHFLAYSLAALLVSVTVWTADRALYRFDTFWNSAHKPLWQLDRFTKEELVRGVSSGLVGAVVFLALLLASRRGSFLGVYLTSTLGTPVFPLFFVDILALLTLLFCEEFLFRHKIQRQLLAALPPGLAVTITGALHVGLKAVQFELTGMDFLNLCLLNLALAFFYLRSDKCHRGLGFVLTLAFFLHPIAGLPLWGNESPSFFLFKSAGHEADLLFGGAAGPFASFALASVLCVLAARAAYAWRKDVEARQQSARISRG